MLYVSLTYFLFLLRFALAGWGGARKQLYFVVLFSLFLFSAFRYQVGCDWQGYYFQYVHFEKYWSTLSLMSEPAWWVFLTLFNELDLPYPVVNVFSSAVFFTGVNTLARRQPDPLGFLVILFPILIINMPMSAIRQGAAIGLMCIAFSAFIDRRPLKYVIWVLLAAGFHPSALIFMLLLPLAAGRFGWQNLIVTVILALPGAYFLALGDSAQMAVRRYIDNEMEAAGAIFRLSFLALTATYYFMFLRRKWKSRFLEDYGLVSIGSIGFMLVLLLIPISTVISDRLGYYLVPIQTMIFARIPFLPFRWNSALHSATPYLLLLLIFTIWSQLSWIFASCYIPYQTWIFGFPDGDPAGF